MESNKHVITVRVTVNAPAEEVWTRWTTPEDILKWNFASDDWQTTTAVNDLTVGDGLAAGWKRKMEALVSTFGEHMTKWITPNELLILWEMDGRWKWTLSGWAM